MSGVTKRKVADVKTEESGSNVKRVEADDVKPEVAVDDPPSAQVKQEDDDHGISAPPVVLFKKRKVKK